ncbi:uncharacterized protein CELE_C06B3.16 [Caenorhabditis elegans]|uniref:Uncharacterized protein n=1 Tax=Caenorhabditis elegans TaxID=6239 RepID=C4ALD7_CAEEL|nr:Uncharacterized protein CELE_C06B3.16 [Caenorhabditis elegans]CAY39356.1 Uncharacterized protein CELE_C06B3.16 [Caenorhabditis elegans]|eukprot:NP_001256549.1 Uncharacterized protein CELE_C06B3.16 [Caenorhabditis elegans]
MFSIYNNEQSKRMKNFYPKGFKLDLCSIPLMMTAEHERINLGYCGNTCCYVKAQLLELILRRKCQSNVAYGRSI